MERNKSTVSLIIVAILCGLFTLLVNEDYQSPKTAKDTVYTYTPEVEKIVEVHTSYSDWALEIPDIDFVSDMVQITKQGTQLPVPLGKPGYYLPYPFHIFIVGHNNSIFNRLSEKPQEIKIWMNKEAQTYNLVNSEVAKTEDVNMDELFKFHGVVIMTCAGERVEDTYSHRLILYYQ